MKRRTLLAGLATLIALPLCGSRRSVLAFTAKPLHDLADVMCYAPSAARAVGSVYLNAVPEEADVHVLEHNIWAALGMLGSPCISSRASLQDHVAQRIRQDFAEGKMVSVEGWMLARTEARLCALTALRNAAS